MLERHRDIPVTDPTRMSTEDPQPTPASPPDVAGTLDAAPRAVSSRIYERFRQIYLTADVRSLAAGRIALALVLLRDLVGRWMQLELWYTNDGIIPNHTLLCRPSWDRVFLPFYLASYLYVAAFGY